MKVTLAAALLCIVSTSVFGQIQALMVDTNWTIVQTNTNTITFRQPIGFGTNTALQAASLTNLGLTSIGNSVVTATNTTSAQSAIGISATNVLSISNVDIGAFGSGSSTGFVGRDTDGKLLLRGTNVGSGVPAFFGWTGFETTAIGMAAARTNLSLQASWLTNTDVTNFRAEIGFPLAALTNTSNVTMMRALAGSTNTNHPFSGTVSVVGTNNTNTLTFSNGILQSVQ